jgi:hypothetical protein
MRDLLYSLFAHAREMLLPRECHFTFHPGRDRVLCTPGRRDYTKYNPRQSAGVLDELSADPGKHHWLKIFRGDRRQMPPHYHEPHQ